MKVRKKTRLCLHCNGVNPLSAMHCAYCSASLQENDSSSMTPTSEPDMFEAPATRENSSFSSETQSQPSSTQSFSEDFSNEFSHLNLEETLPSKEEPLQSKNFEQKASDSENKPLYSVYDQPNRLYERESAPSEHSNIDQSESMKSEFSFWSRSRSRLKKYYSRINPLFASYVNKAEKQSLSLVKEYLSIASLIMVFTAQIAFVWTIMLLFFSTDGLFVMSWPSSDWPYFASLALILGPLGFRLLKKIDG